MQNLFCFMSFTITNRPPHIFLDDTYYFIAARTINSIGFFNTHKKKRILVKVIRKALETFKYSCYAWVILDNHYHLLIKTSKGSDLSKFIKAIHAESAVLLNKLEKRKGRKIWWNYWDKCIRDERDFWKHFNYIHHNPVKHGVTKDQNLVCDYSFCSYRQWSRKESQEWLDLIFEQYPIVDFTVQGDDF